MAILTAPDAKTFLGITGTAEDAWLTLVVPMVDRLVKSYCGQNLESQAYTQFYDGTGARLLLLRETPVTAVASVYLDLSARAGQNPDGAFAADTLLTAGTDYFWHKDGYLPGTTTDCGYKGFLERINGGWPRAVRYSPGQISGVPGDLGGCIKVTYTAGYTTTVPTDITLAALDILKVIRASKGKAGPLASESLGQYSYATAQQALGSLPALGTARQVLAKYRRVAV